jgi:hypothetical protein
MNDIRFPTRKESNKSRIHTHKNELNTKEPVPPILTSTGFVSINARTLSYGIVSK